MMDINNLDEAFEHFFKAAGIDEQHRRTTEAIFYTGADYALMMLGRRVNDLSAELDAKTTEQAQSNEED